MKYSFKQKIENGENGAYFDIPFNVWEVAKKEGEIPVKVRVEDIMFVCNLEPKDTKGGYIIPLQPEVSENFEADKEYSIAFRLVKSDVSNSPYSTANPIRKIDSIDILIQPHDGLCGQSCVAMLAGITLDETINIMHCNEWQATILKIINALNYFGIEHSEELVYTMGRTDVKLPKCAVILETMGRFSHYLVTLDGKFYDPNLGIMERYDLTKMKGYLEVLV